MQRNKATKNLEDIKVPGLRELGEIHVRMGLPLFAKKV